MSGIVSRWPVLFSRTVDADDRDDTGRLTPDAAKRLFAEGRGAYFALCSTADEATLRIVDGGVETGPAAAGDAVTVSVSVVEIYDDRFTMNLLVRPNGPGEGDTAAKGWCALSPPDGVTTAMRDEFIALAHAAAHFH